MVNCGRLSGLLLVMAVSALLLFGCAGNGGSGGSAKEAISLIPAKANGYILVKVKDIMADADVKAQFRGPAYEEAMKQYTDAGIDLEKIESAVLFLNSNQAQYSSDSNYFGLIIKGGIDGSKFVSYLKQQGSGSRVLGETSYNGYSIYYDQGWDPLTQGLHIAFLGDGFTVLGSEQSIKDVIDVYKGNAKPLNNAALDRVKGKIDSNGWAYVAMAIPDSMKSQLKQSSSQSYQGVSIESFASVEAVGASISKKGGKVFTSEIAMQFGSEADASKSQKVLDAGRNLVLEGGMVSQIARDETEKAALEAILSSVSVSSSGDVVMLKYDSGLEYSSAGVAQILLLYASFAGPSPSSSVTADQSKLYWKSMTPISIMGYTVSSETGFAQLDLQNVLNEDITITSITFAGTELTGLTDANLSAGQRKTVSGTVREGVICGSPGASYSYHVVFTYNTRNLLGKQEIGDKDLIGKCT
ncbi:Uncharacterised protein [Candidatus Gugararchaeum adminiculabundum]|nr:Uncharacterised protein [Candidatus Gugararchaeum adminiculabundum]